MPYAVKWEIARLISMNRIDYDTISTEILTALEGTNAQVAPDAARKILETIPSDSNQLADPAFAQEAAAKVRITYVFHLTCQQ